jgi:hypothetical protein
MPLQAVEAIFDSFESGVYVADKVFETPIDSVKADIVAHDNSENTSDNDRALGH